MAHCSPEGGCGGRSPRSFSPQPPWLGYGASQLGQGWGMAVGEGLCGLLHHNNGAPLSGLGCCWGKDPEALLTQQLWPGHTVLQLLAALVKSLNGSPPGRSCLPPPPDPSQQVLEGGPCGGGAPFSPSSPPATAESHQLMGGVGQG